MKLVWLGPNPCLHIAYDIHEYMLFKNILPATLRYHARWIIDLNNNTLEKGSVRFTPEEITMMTLRATNYE